jgi:hypothetical protein
VFGPPDALDALGAFGGDDLVQGAPPPEAQGRSIRHFRHRFNWLWPRQQPQRTRRKLYLLAITTKCIPTGIVIDGLRGESSLGQFRNMAVLSR